MINNTDKRNVSLKYFKILLSLVLVLTLSGCWSSRELDELAIVMGIGIDKNGEEIECTTQIIIPQNIGAGKEGGPSSKKPYVNYITRDGELSSCISKVSNLTGKSVFMSHNLVAVIGEETAEGGIYKYLDYLMRDNQLRLSVSLLVTDESTEDVLDAESDLLQIPSMNISKISAELPQNFSGQNITVLKFIENMMSKQKGSLVPMITLEDNKTKVSGAAVFSGDKMVGHIDDDEIKGVLWLLGDITGGDVILNTDDGSLSLRIGKIKTKTKPVIDKNGEIYISTDIKGDLYLVRDDANIINTVGMDAVLGRLNRSVEKDVLSSLAKMQDIGVDIYGFGDMIYRKNPDVWRAIESSWGDRFKNLRVDVCADCNIIETGSIIGSVRNSKANSE